MLEKIVKNGKNLVMCLALATSLGCPHQVKRPAGIRVGQGSATPYEARQTLTSLLLASGKADVSVKPGRIEYSSERVMQSTEPRGQGTKTTRYHGTSHVCFDPKSITWMSEVKDRLFSDALWFYASIPDSGWCGGGGNVNERGWWEPCNERGFSPCLRFEFKNPESAYLAYDALNVLRRGGSESYTSTPTAPQQGGCTKDTDCKGERICSDGRCVNP